jgi:hypothetical protein
MKYSNMEWHIDRRLVIDVHEDALPLLANRSPCLAGKSHRNQAKKKDTSVHTQENE